MVYHRDTIGAQGRHISDVGATLFIRWSCCSGDVIRVSISNTMGFEGGIMADIFLRSIYYLAMAWVWVASASSLFFFSVALHIVKRTQYIDASVPTSHFIMAGFAEAFCAFCIYVNRENF